MNYTFNGWKGDEAEQVFSDYCEEKGICHTEDCYEQQSAGRGSEVFWICSARCPVMAARFEKSMGPLSWRKP